MTASELRQQGREAYPHYCNPYKRNADYRAYDEWEEGFAQAKWSVECEIRKMIMDNEMIERVAKAICPWAGKKHPTCPDPETGCRVCLANAFEAIKAMREPTAAMVKTLIKKHGFLPHADFWADVWNTGIDAVIND